MRLVILVILFCIALVYVLDHSFFIAGTGTILVGLAVAGCALYALLATR